MTVNPKPFDHRPTRLEVDLRAIDHNLRRLQKNVAPAALWPVVKANAYGHGMEEIAMALEKRGVDGLCVATFSEGQHLRQRGIAAPILVLGGAFGPERCSAAGLKLICAVRDIEDLRLWSSIENKQLALKIDAGMHRLGIQPEHLSEVPELISADAVALVMTHLPSNELDSEDTRTQELLDVFDNVFARLVRDGVCTEATPRSALNSAGCMRDSFYRYEFVRPGLALYGMDPRPQCDGLEQSARLVSAISALRNISTGERVGYEGAFIAGRPTRVATVPIGYGDGYLRANATRAQVLVREQRAPVIGRISMDQVTIDVTDIEGVRRGDEVVLLGPQGNARITADELASWSQTISYEITTLISERVPRRYIGVASKTSTSE